MGEILFYLFVDEGREKSTRLDFCFSISNSIPVFSPESPSLTNVRAKKIYLS
jgi:hypothetical protein